MGGSDFLWRTKRMKHIFSQKLAGYLMYRGFVLLKVCEDLKNPRKHVFIFNESKEIRDAIDDYAKLKK